MFIYSMTAKCNLNCQGCYAKLLHAPRNGEFNADSSPMLSDKQTILAFLIYW